MPTFEQVVDEAGAGRAGDQDGRNVYKVLFDTEPCSDQPQLQAWDDENLNTLIGESLVGTIESSGESMIAAAHTTNIKTGGAWVPGASSAGEGAMQDPNTVGTSHRANRLRGNESYLALYDAGDGVPVAAEERFFQLAALAAADSASGVAGHLPVLAIKAFYAGAPPTVSFHYNKGEDDLLASQVNADWIAMTSSPKGTPMAIGLLNTINFTGLATTVTGLDSVTKPGSGTKAAEEQWIQTAL
jgi:hypothetical protein